MTSAVIVEDVEEKGWETDRMYRVCASAVVDSNLQCLVDMGEGTGKRTRCTVRVGGALEGVPTVSSRKQWLYHQSSKQYCTSIAAFKQ